MVMLGALGALIFTVWLLPYLLTNSYFENYQFVKDFKQGKIVVNQEKSVYIQQNAAIQDAMVKAEKSVVTIQSLPLGLQSGFIATSDGLVVVLAQALGANKNFSVYVAGQLVNSSVVKIDKKNNIALLKIDKNNLQTVGFTDINSIKLGQEVFLVAPTSITQDNWIANEGIVRQIDVSSIKTNIIEKPIVAGGPLFNAAGQLMGLNFVDSDGKISAVPVDKIQSLLGL
jgi:S1-C subfamily serine protease